MTTNTNAALPDAVRVPLDSLHADAEYLCARLLDKSLTREEVVTAIRSRIDAAKAALTTAAPVAQGDAEDAARLDFMIEHRAYVVSDPDACPGYWLHFVHKETGRTWVQCDEHPTPRAAIDAARSQQESVNPT